MFQRGMKELVLYKSYDPEVYPHYENYDGIDIASVTDIPRDMMV